MSTESKCALAHPNIALIKYWGNRDHKLRLPSNGSISMTLSHLETRTCVEFVSTLVEDRLVINNEEQNGSALERASSIMDVIRIKADFSKRANVISESNFPLGAGIASSASGFAALTVAASAAADLDLDSIELSRIARLGSGSACRSILGGFVEWNVGKDDRDSYAVQLADQNHWDLRDLIVILEKGHKTVGSAAGHELAETSPLQDARIRDTVRRLQICREAILSRDFPSLSSIVEEDSNMMHAVMMTSDPQLIYWKPGTIAIMKSVHEWRLDGMEVCFTIDAGPNVHCLCTPPFEDALCTLLLQIPGVIDVIRSSPGGPAHLISPESPAMKRMI
jgi:diphosphomevalonate decarboxylase